MTTREYIKEGGVTMPGWEETDIDVCGMPYDEPEASEDDE